jgi:hypothetical protein
MKVYELVAELLKYPAGYEVEVSVGKSGWSPAEDVILVVTHLAGHGVIGIAGDSELPSKVRSEE